MEIITSILLVLVVLAVPLILFTYMREDMDVVIMAIAGTIIIFALWSNWEEKKNAEFEAKNCPQMLQVDSEYCKPTGDK